MAPEPEVQSEGTNGSRNARARCDSEAWHGAMSAIQAIHPQAYQGSQKYRLKLRGAKG